MRRRFGVGAIALVAASAFTLGLCLGLVMPSRMQASRGKLWSAENSQIASVNVVAVRSDGPGVMLNLSVTIEPGEGKILVDTHPLVGFDFQYANRTATKVACELTGYALSAKGGIEGADILFEVSIPTGERVKIQAIDGPSAGAAATVAIIAALKNQEVRSDVVITGTVNREDHRIGVARGVFPKAEAAEKKSGIDLFLVPEDQPIEVYERVGFFTIARLKSISYLQSHAKQEGWNLEIREVSTIEKAAEIMLTK